MATDAAGVLSRDPLVELHRALDSLAALEPASLCDRGSLTSLHRARCRVDGVLARAASALESSGAYADDGAQNATAWLATELRASKSELKKALRVGEVLKDLPAFSESLSAGRITSAHVGLVAGVLNERTRAALGRDEKLLVAEAETLRFFQFRQALSYWAQLADPDGAEEGAEAQRARRSVYLHESFGGTYLGKMTLDPISGTTVFNELNRLEDLLFESDWNEARERLGREPKPSELSRTHEQRRADALVEMARRSASMPTDARHPRPLFSVLVDFPTIQGRICELARGTVVTPGSLLPYLDEALIERAVYGPGARIEVSEKARLFSGATRRAIELRDRRCTHPCCDRPAEICQVDHILPYSEGGLTTQENGRLLCKFHNRWRVHGEHIGDDG